MQVNSHAAPLQTGVAFAGVVQVAHAFWQRNVPGLHAKSHVEPLHVGIALATAGHTTHELPHAFASFATQVWPHA